MEIIQNQGEYERSSTEICESPICEILQNEHRAREVWPDETENFYSQIEQHHQDALLISEYLDQLSRHDETPEAKESYYNATSSILQNPELERFALFLPFESLPQPEETSNAANNFRESFLSTWCDLLYCQDVRANFFDGDIIEPDARTAEPERTVKAAHLTPWIVKRGLAEIDDIIDLVGRIDDPTLTRSLLDTKPVLEDWGLLDLNTGRQLKQLATGLPPQPAPSPPKYISPKRQRWLAQKTQGIERPDSTFRELDQPFSRRKVSLQSEINYTKNLAANLNSNVTYNVICIGGSRVKGYGRPDSDLDLWIPTKIVNPTDLFSKTPAHDSFSDEPIHTVALDEVTHNLPKYAHLFNTFWIGTPENILNFQRELLPHYFRESNQTTRSFVTERLEQDLLEYRLMHKGYPSFYSDSNPEYKNYPTIDGSSAFYETKYRILATKLFANYIFVPKSEI